MGIPGVSRAPRADGACKLGWNPPIPDGPADPGARAPRGTSSKPPGEYTVVGLSTCGRRWRAPGSRAGCPVPCWGAPARARSRPCPREFAACLCWPAGSRPRTGSADGRDRPGDADLPIWENAKTSRVIRPTARPAALRATPKLVTRPAGCPWTRCTAVLTTTRIAPSMIATALATDKVMTSRTLPAVSERTAQRSHRGYRPAS
jgi:hypothetical protein